MNYEQYSQLGSPQGQRDALIKLQFETKEVLDDILSSLKRTSRPSKGLTDSTQLITPIQNGISAKGTLDGLEIFMVGDLKYGRTVHSLLMAMSKFKTTT